MPALDGGGELASFSSQAMLAGAAAPNDSGHTRRSNSSLMALFKHLSIGRDVARSEGHSKDHRHHPNPTVSWTDNQPEIAGGVRPTSVLTIGPG